MRATARSDPVSHVSKAPDSEAMIAFAEKEFGKLDVLFNNAGVYPKGDGPDGRESRVRRDAPAWTTPRRIAFTRAGGLC